MARNEPNTAWLETALFLAGKMKAYLHAWVHADLTDGIPCRRCGHRETRSWTDISLPGIDQDHKRQRSVRRDDFARARHQDAGGASPVQIDGDIQV